MHLLSYSPSIALESLPPPSLALQKGPALLFFRSHPVPVPLNLPSLALPFKSTASYVDPLPSALLVTETASLLLSIQPPPTLKPAMAPDDHHLGPSDLVGADLSQANLIRQHRQDAAIREQTAKNEASASRATQAKLVEESLLAGILRNVSLQGRRYSFEEAMSDRSDTAKVPKNVSAEATLVHVYARLVAFWMLDVQKRINLRHERPVSADFDENAKTMADLPFSALREYVTKVEALPSIKASLDGSARAVGFLAFGSKFFEATQKGTGKPIDIIWMATRLLPKDNTSPEERGMHHRDPYPLS
jgi:hypothetical protein